MGGGEGGREEGREALSDNASPTLLRLFSEIKFSKEKKERKKS